MPTSARPRRASSATGGIKRATTSGMPGSGSPPPTPPTTALRRTKTAESMDRRKFRSTTSSRGESPGAIGGSDTSPSKKHKRGKSSDANVVGWQRSNHGASKSPNRRSGAVRSISDGTLRAKGGGDGGGMSASTPGQSIRRTASPPGDVEDPRERAMSIMERIDRRGSDASDFSLGDSMDFASTQQQGTRTMMSQSTPGGSTRGRTMSTKGNYSTNLHSSVTARRFLEHDDSDDSDEFELKASSLMGMGKYSTNANPTNNKSKAQQKDMNDSWMGRLSDSLHSLSDAIDSKISLKFGSNEDDDDDDDDDDDEMHDLDHSQSSEQEILFEKSLFSNRLRQDLTEVDQSVNLMNAEAAKYDVSNRGNRKRGLHNKNNHGTNVTMVEMFLSERTNAPTGQRKGFCDCVILCFLLIFILVVATGFLASPYVEDIEWPSIFENDSNNSNNNAAASTSSPTATPTKTTNNDKDEETESTATILENTLPQSLLPEDVVNKLTSPYYEPDVIQERELALEELLLSKADSTLITKTAAARKANEWIVAYDPAQMEFHDNDSNSNSNSNNSVDILQRYALAVLFFVTHPNVEPKTAPHEIISTRQQQSYRVPGNNKDENDESGAAKEESNNDDSNRRHLSSHLTFVDWMTATHVCWWEGLGCNNNEDRVVTEIKLSESRMYGTLPLELGLLTSLTQIDFSHNRLHRQVPPQYAESLTKLESLHLFDNELTGTVSLDFCQLDNLESFITDCETTDMECECCSECL